MGPVTPLLAVAEEWKAQNPEVEFLWVGTKNGPERRVVQDEGIRFLYLPVARFPRYLSLELLLLPFRLMHAFIVAWSIIGRERPSLVASAGGFTGVPLIFAASLRGIPTWTHQQDARPLLSNLLVMPFVRRITVAWQGSLKHFPAQKTKWVGNPVRRSMLEGKKDEAHDLFGIDLRIPTVLVFGGGGGAMWLNHMMGSIGASFNGDANIIHITGKGKKTNHLANIGPRYFVTEFLSEEMAHAYAAADVVVARAGMGTISELAALKKAAVLIPLPHSAQEQNVLQIKEVGAAMVLDQRQATTGDLKAAIANLLQNKERRIAIGERMHALLPTKIAPELIGLLEEEAK